MDTKEKYTTTTKIDSSNCYFDLLDQAYTADVDGFIIRSNKPLIEKLLSNKEFVNSLFAGESILMKACRQKNILMIIDIINAGADLNLQDRNGNTALYYVVLGEEKNYSDMDILTKRDIIVSLIQSGANIDIINNENKKCTDYMSDRLKIALEECEMAF